MGSLSRVSSLVLVLQAAWLLHASPLHAQSPQDAQLAQARAHYERGLVLFDEGRLPASLAEFEAAYADSHRPAILYNMGSVLALMGNAVLAVDTLRRYLREGGGSIEASRREAVENEIEIQEARIARVTVASNVAGAEVSLDDVPVGTTPIESLRVSAGEHVFSARAEGFDPTRIRFSVAGLEERTITLELSARATDSGVLELTTNVPGATVELDGRSLGLTPIEFPVGVAAGSHTLRVTRPGYREHERIVPVAPGARVVLEIELSLLDTLAEGIATRLELTLPSTSHTVRVDGQRITGSSVRLPYGLHDLAIEAADIEPVAQRLLIPQQPSFAFDPGYRWTESGRHARLAGADSQRVNGGAVVAVGAVVALTGAGLLIGREVMSSTSSLPARIAAFAVGGRCENITSTPEPCENFLRENPAFERDPEGFFNRTQELIGISESLNIAGWVLLGTGVGVIVGGVTVMLTAPSAQDIDGGTTLRASLELTPTGLLLHGQF